MKKNKNNFSRRGFLSTAVTAAASASLTTLTPGFVQSQESGTKPEEKKKDIIYRPLGKTGINLPIISMGVMNANNPEIVQASYESGVRHFDTAALYQYGRNEQMLGRVIKKMGVRDDVFIATKIFHRDQRQSYPPEQRKEGLLKAFQASLKRLDMDYVDLLYIHSIYGDSNLVGIWDPGTMEGLKELKKQGKVRYFGVSTHRGMTEVLNEVAEKGFYDVVLTGINVSMASNTALLKAIDKAASKGIGVIAMKTQAGGSRLPNPETSRNFTSSVINTASLKWVMKNKSITTSIPGYTNYEHLNENFSVATNIEYSDEEKKFLTGNNIELTFGFCHQCAKCIADCPYETEIPKLIRTHMYAAQYGNFEHARITMNTIPSKKGLSNCSNCDACSVKCYNHVDINNRINELKLIYG